MRSCTQIWNLICDSPSLLVTPGPAGYDPASERHTTLRTKSTPTTNNRATARPSTGSAAAHLSLLLYCVSSDDLSRGSVNYR